MLSSDKNIETIGQLVDALRRYVALEGENLKLGLVDKVVRLLTAAAITLCVAVLLMLMLIYLSFAAAYALATFTGMAAAFALVAAVYLLALIVCVAKRRQWIEQPLVRFLASILMEG